jgi:uncharacterized membrane protein YfcA
MSGIIEVIQLAPAAIAGSALGWFVTHLPERVLRAGDRFFGEVER